ncbi:MAG: CHAT domain-containing protein, partial [Desulfobacterales bacterium]|nr:CHAT domain-containing protein [Desulfobacterales bacterium]
REDIRWYLEVYAVQYTAEPDDDRAERIENKLKTWGEALFAQAFSSDLSKRIFYRFYDACGQEGGLITIDTAIPEILSLPWELLCVEGRQLVHEYPHMAIRHRLSGAGGVGPRFRPEPKDKLHVLFVVSRPREAGFMDPRADPLAVMDAMEAEAPGRVSVEFLRPPTLDNLTHRLKRLSAHKGKPMVDIIHFDGHGVFDKEGGLMDKARRTDPEAALRDGSKTIKPDTGYLLFEDDKGAEALITAETLGNMLTNQRVALAVLSACQSAAVGRADPMSGVAARLTHAGIPSVIAMSHSVLAVTTRQLFGAFYARMAGGMGAGAALDEARQNLYAHPERGERRRGETGRITLKLQDWFLPALYQSGDDPPLLTAGPGSSAAPSSEAAGPARTETLPPAGGAGFHGRGRELWIMERAFVSNVRRITVSGFGGQGKTFLAAEAGRWLVRTGLFDRAAFVGFADYQGVDPLRFAVTTLAKVLDRNLIDAAEAEKALAEIPTLLILDNLEALGDEGRNALLDAAAGWSRAGASRVLITTRQADPGHSAWPVNLDPEHLRLPLEGLAESDALAWFAALWDLPPEPERKPPKPHVGLVKLFQQVDFHPLSVGLLAFQLKFRAAADLGERLEVLLTDAPGHGPDRNLMASLNLSIERLDPEARKWLPRLGVFHGGAMEDVLLEVTRLGADPEVAMGNRLMEAFQSGDPIAIAEAAGIDLPEGIELSDELEEGLRRIAKENSGDLEKALEKTPSGELAKGADESTWPALRQALEAAGLIQAEKLPGVASPYLKFHPTLAPALWPRLDKPDGEALAARHRAAYYRLSGKLYHLDDKDPHAARAVARRELPNLLFAVRAALAAGEEDGVEFADSVNIFLNFFGLTRDRDDLTARAEKVAAPGSRAWYLAMSNKGKALFDAGRHREAEAVFREILRVQGDEASYERCVTLDTLGRCMRAAGRTPEAVKAYRDGLAVAEKLDRTEGVRRQTGVLQTGLGDALRYLGEYVEARAAYEAGLEIDKTLGDQ